MFVELLSVLSFDMLVMLLFIQYIINFNNLSVFTLNVEDTLHSQSKGVREAFSNLNFESRLKLINDMIIESKANIVILQYVPKNTAMEILLCDFLSDLNYDVDIKTITNSDDKTIAGFRNCTLVSSLFNDGNGNGNGTENGNINKHKMLTYNVNDRRGRDVNIKISYSYNSHDNILNTEITDNTLYIGQPMKTRLGRNHCIPCIMFPHEVDFSSNWGFGIQRDVLVNNPTELRELYLSSIEKDGINMITEYYMPVMSTPDLNIKNIVNLINVNGHIMYSPDMNEVQFEYLRIINTEKNNIISSNWCGVIIDI